jgi:asparagine synthase (glutamine-hydrolysing)
MINIQLSENKAYRWHVGNNMYVRGYLFAPDGTLYQDEDLSLYFSNIVDENDFHQKLLEANGMFSVIIQKNKIVWITVDRFRYFPLFYRQKGDCLYISDEVNRLYDDNEPKVLDPEAHLGFSGCSYVLGNKTLLKDTFQVQAGEYIVYDGNRIIPTFYHQHFAEIQPITFEDAKIKLKTILQSLAEQLPQLIGDRPVFLSLSGGLDSRLIAYLLKIAGIKNVLCFTFGKKEGNPEWERSKIVAEKLGFSWMFIDYTSIPNTQFYQQKRFVDFYTYEAQYVSKFGFMQYFAANYLMDVLKITPNSIMLSGHGGDFFSGKNLRPYMQTYNSTAIIAKDLQYIHCNLIHLKKKERDHIRTMIRREMVDILPLFENIEKWGLKERQAKYILNTNKIWEHYGMKTLIPLCDKKLMDFFVTLPFEYRLNQKLYKTVISELFDEFDICFLQDNRQQEKSIIQEIKILIKRFFPFLRKKKNLFHYDYFDYERLVQPVVQELKNANRYQKIRDMNGIFLEWYLMQIEMETANYK